MDLMPECTGFALRIDLQVTLRLSTSLPSFGRSLLKFSPTMTPLPSRSRTRRGVAVATDSLWLGTVGRRTSPSYIRVYDKGVEAKCDEPGRLWRVEVESKGSHSRTLGCKHQSDLRRAEWCAQYCVQQLRSRGCCWPYGAFTNERCDVSILPDERPNATRLAAWIVQTVAPTIPRLLTVYTVDEVLQMLNLSDVAASTGRDNAHGSPARNDRD